FPDTHRGWVLMCPGDTCYESTDDDLPRYDLATTDDAGSTWSISRISIPREANVPPGMDSYAGEISFADRLHGWLKVTGFAGHSSWGVLLITSDGGKSWQTASAQTGSSSPIELVTPDEGWESGTVTRDGARSWHDLTIPIPKALLGLTKDSPEPDICYCDLPRFDHDDLKHGFMYVSYSAAESSGKA